MYLTLESLPTPAYAAQSNDLKYLMCLAASSSDELASGHEVDAYCARRMRRVCGKRWLPKLGTQRGEEKLHANFL